jgi:hypothetical protein
MSKTMMVMETVSEEKRKEIENSARNSGRMVLKALLNRLDAKAFPLKKEADPFADEVAVMVGHLSSKAFKMLRPRLEKLRANPARPDFVLQTPVKPLPKISVSEENLPKNGNMVPRAGNFRSVQLLVRALHCVDETDPEGGADDMILGGVLIGASGNMNVVNSRLCGSFDTGERIEYPLHIQHFGNFSLNTTATYPKVFFAVFKLIESDGIDIEEASGLTELLNLLCTIARNSVQKPDNLIAYPLYASQLALMLWYLTFVTFEEEDFPPCLVNIKINDLSAAESENLRTNDIRGNGGTYRIGYKWKLLK